jgi:hypothetical protein
MGGKPTVMITSEDPRSCERFKILIISCWAVPKVSEEPWLKLSCAGAGAAVRTGGLLSVEGGAGIAVGGGLGAGLGLLAGVPPLAVLGRVIAIRSPLPRQDFHNFDMQNITGIVTFAKYQVSNLV